MNIFQSVSHQFRVHPYRTAFFVAVGVGGVFVALVGSTIIPPLGITGLIGLGGVLSTPLIIAFNSALTVLIGAMSAGSVSSTISFLIKKIHIKMLDKIEIDNMPKSEEEFENEEDDSFQDLYFKIENPKFKEGLKNNTNIMYYDKVASGYLKVSSNETVGQIKKKLTALITSAGIITNGKISLFRQKINNDQSNANGKNKIFEGECSSDYEDTSEKDEDFLVTNSIRIALREN